MPRISKLEQQQKFVKLLRSLVPSQVNLARDLMDLLEISQDGAYRRLRCQTAISLDETVKICLHYSVPLEALNNEVPDVVTFQFHALNDDAASFRNYLESLLEQLQNYRKHDTAHIHYAAEDVPVFYHFGWPELSTFKVLYWMKSILHVPALETIHFPADLCDWIDPELISRLYQTHAQIAGTEIWTNETIESTLQQIRFYWDAGFFEDHKSLLNLLDQVDQLLIRIARQAETGQKIGINGESTGAPFRMYLCDLMIGNNSIYVTAGDSVLSSIGYNTFNSILTRNEAFNKQHFSWMENLKRKSIQISGMAEKIRNQFFKAQRMKVDALRKEVSA